MVAFGASYGRLRQLGEVEAIFAGLNAAVVAIVAQVAWDLGARMRKPWQFAAALASLVAVELGIGVVEVVLATATLALVGHGSRSLARSRPLPVLVPAMVLLPKLALVFFRIGLVGFGGGLATIPILEHEVVDTLHWLDAREFADAITLGQITPGPIAITATFVGYRVAGPAGAVIATVATFLPAFVASVAARRSIAAFRRSPAVAAILGALAPVVVGIVGAAVISLARASIVGWVDAATVAACLVVLLALRWPPLLVLTIATLIRAGTLLL